MALTDEQKARVRKHLLGRPQDDSTGRFASAIGGVGRGVGRGLGAIPKAAGILAEKGEEILTGEKADVKDSLLYGLGESIQEGFEAVTPDINPEYEQEYQQQLAEGIGSLLSNLGPGLLAKTVAKGATVAAGLGAAQVGTEGFEDAMATMEADGKDPEFDTAFASYLANAPVGLSEAAPIYKIFKRLDRASGGSFKKHMIEGIKGAGEEGLQELFQNTMGNLIASDIVRYDEGRGLFTDGTQAATVGGGVGFIANVAASMLGGRKIGRFTKAAAETVGETEQDPELNPKTGEEFVNSDIKKKAGILAGISSRLQTETTSTDVRQRLEEERDLILDDIKQHTVAKEEGQEVDKIAKREAQDVLDFYKEQYKGRGSLPLPEVESDTGPMPVLEDVEGREALPLPVVESDTGPRRVQQVTMKKGAVQQPDEVLPTTEEDVQAVVAKALGVDNITDAQALEQAQLEANAKALQDKINSVNEPKSVEEVAETTNFNELIEDAQEAIDVAQELGKDTDFLVKRMNQLIEAKDVQGLENLIDEVDTAGIEESIKLAQEAERDLDAQEKADLDQQINEALEKPMPVQDTDTVEQGKVEEQIEERAPTTSEEADVAAEKIVTTTEVETAREDPEIQRAAARQSIEKVQAEVDQIVEEVDVKQEDTVYKTKMAMLRKLMDEGTALVNVERALKHIAETTNHPELLAIDPAEFYLEHKKNQQAATMQEPVAVLDDDAFIGEEKLTLAALKKVAKESGVKGYSKYKAANRDELVQKLKNANSDKVREAIKKAIESAGAKTPRAPKAKPVVAKAEPKAEDVVEETLDTEDADALRAEKAMPVQETKGAGEETVTEADDELVERWLSELEFSDDPKAYDKAIKLLPEVQLRKAKNYFGLGTAKLDQAKLKKKEGYEGWGDEEYGGNSDYDYSPTPTIKPLVSTSQAFDPTTGAWMGHRITGSKGIHYRNRMKQVEAIFNKMVAQAKKNVGQRKVRFVLIKDLKQAQDLDIDRKYYTENNKKKMRFAKDPMDLGYAGVHYNNGKETIIAINAHSFANNATRYPIGSESEMIDKVARTFLHEYVGHFGFREIFGKSGYNTFIDKTIETNPQVAYEAFLQGQTRWKSYYNPEATDIIEIKVKTPAGKIRKQKVSKELMRRYMDEYFAETAAKFQDKTIRDTWTKDRKRWSSRVYTLLKHLFRKVFSTTVVSKTTDEDITGIAAESFQRLMGGPDGALEKAMEFRDKGYVITPGLRKIPLKDDKNYTSTPPINPKEVATMPMEHQPEYNEENAGDWQYTKEGERAELVESLKQIAEEGLSTERVTQLEAIRDTNMGKLRQNAVANFGAKMYQAFKQRFPIIYRTFNAEGTFRKWDMKQNLAYDALGDISKYYKMAREAEKTLKDMSGAKRQAVMDFMTSDTTDLSSTTFTPEEQESLRSYKRAITDFGDRLVRLGYLNPETHAEYRGKYLPTRYLQYVGRSTGFGRKASPLNYLMKKDRSISESMDGVLLGKIEDPEFLIPEAISMIGRDVALLEYTEMISKLSQEQPGLGWVLADYKVAIPGRSRAVSLHKAESVRNTWDDMLTDYNTGNEAHNLTEAEAKTIQANLVALDQNLAEQQAKVETKIREQFQIPNDQPLPELLKEPTLGGVYKRMPAERGYGSLAGKYVRKELYDEFVESEVIDSHMMGLAKAFAPGGKVDRWNQIWKSMKVPFNIPSWFRNGAGNGVLLDVSTPTNTIKLSGMLIDEVTKVLKGDASEYWQMAHDKGLFGTTFSTSEIYLLGQEYTRLKKAQIVKELDGIKGSFKSGYLQLQAAYATIGEMAANGYGNLEGIFKTVSMRDYIQRWEKTNERSLKSLSQAEQDAVIADAVKHAHEAIFDYSELTAWQKDLRRSAFGAPFLTYTMKAGPAVLRGLARHPQKFIKYAALPYILTAMALHVGDFTEEELEEWERLQPQWMKEKSSVYVLPKKDANGKLVPMDFGYYFPWAPWQDAALKVKGNWKDVNSIEDFAYAGVTSAADTAKSLGLLGGPVPTVIAGLLTNKDTFMGQDIVAPGDNAGTKLAKMLDWSYTLWMPPWLTSTGVTGRLMDHYNLSITGLPNRNVDIFGEQRETMLSTAMRGVGMSTYPTTIPEMQIRKTKEINAKVMEIERAKRKLMKNQSIPHDKKLKELAEFNRRIQVIRKQQ